MSDEARHPTAADTPRQSAGSAVRAATTIAMWSAAGASADRMLDVLTAVGVDSGIRAGTAAASRRSGLPGPGMATAPLVELLPVLRSGGPARLVLPVPGDLRGLAPQADVVTAALAAGAAVTLPDAGLALVPVGRQWHVHEAGMDHPEMAHRDARMVLDDGVREATRSLIAADVSPAAGGDPRELVRRRILAEEVELPPGTPTAASELLGKAITLEALLHVAASHGPGVTARHLAHVTAALQPLGAAAREARRTAVALTTTALHPASSAAATPHEPATRRWAQ